jgi:hypothetical protein
VLPSLGLAIFTGPTASEYAQTLRVKHEGGEIDEGEGILLLQSLDLLPKGAQHQKGVWLPLVARALPLFPLGDAIAKERDQFCGRAGPDVKGELGGHDQGEKRVSAVCVMEESGGHGKVTLAVIGSGSPEVNVCPNESQRLSRGYALGTTQESVPTGRFEPATKIGGARFHSLVVAVSNHSLVCGDK